MHRRHLLAAGAATLPAALMTAMHSDTANRPTSPAATKAETLGEVQADVTKLAAGWGATAPYDALTVINDLKARAGLLARGVRRPGPATEWAYICARILLMEAQLYADSRRAPDAMHAAASAITWAVRAADPAGAAHGRVIAASVARAARSSADPGRLLATACSSAGAGYAVAIARAARADALASAGASPSKVWDAVRGTLAADLGSGRVGFALDGWDPATMSAHLGGTLAKVGLAAPARDHLAVAAAAFGPGTDGQVQRPGSYAMGLLYESRLGLVTGDVDSAGDAAWRALTVTEDTPPPIVAAGAFNLARDARATGGQWIKVRELAVAALPAYPA